MKEIRSELGMSRAAFATHYGFDYSRLLNFEQGFRSTLQVEEIGVYLELIHLLGKDPRKFFPCPQLPEVKDLKRKKFRNRTPVL